MHEGFWFNVYQILYILYYIVYRNTATNIQINILIYQGKQNPLCISLEVGGNVVYSPEMMQVPI